MLKIFEVDNFRGFDAPVEINFTAGSYAFNDAVVKGGLVKNAIIYGKNGVGKSALGIAIFDLVSHLTDNERISDAYLRPYCNQNTGKNVVRFRYVFDFDGDQVEYEYEKGDIDNLLREKLFVNGELIVNYDYFSTRDRYIKPGLVPMLNVDLPDNKLSVLKYIYRNTPTNTVPPVAKLISFVERMLWYRSLSDGNDYAGFQTGSGTLDEKIYESGSVNDFEDFLRQNGIEYKLSFVERDGNKHVMVVNFADGRVVPFERIASTGTKALRLFFYWSITAFNNVSFLFIDEFDAFLHYESAASIVKILNKIESFQSVLTSHNTYLMRNDLTRPDCCFIMTKNKISPLCKATDRILREGHNLEKLYINGAFTEP